MSETAAVVGVAAETAVAPGASGAWQPYRRSWVDAITVWVDGLPGPAWGFYRAFGRVHTMPFQVGTLGAVVSAIVLPVALWFVTRLLERVV